MPEPTVTVLHARGVLDVDTGDVIDNGYVRVEGNRITAGGHRRERAAGDADEIDRAARPHAHPRPHGHGGRPRPRRARAPGSLDPVQTDPVKMTLRGVANAQRTLRAGFTTVRNLGLFVKTGGYLLDVALSEAVERGLGRRAPHRARRPRHRARPAATSTRARRAGWRRT